MQQFKLGIANAVVNADNASLRTMDTDRLLDLFNVSQDTPAARLKQSAAAAAAADAMESDAAATAGAAAQDEGARKRKRGGVLADLQEMWDQSQYDEEYNMDAFLSSLKRG